MRIRRLKIVLRTAGLCFSLLAAVTAMGGFLWPVALSLPEKAAVPVATDRTSQQSAAARPSMMQWEVCWKRPLRRPLVDPPPPNAAAHNAGVAPRAMMPNVRLLGIAFEARRPLAIVATPEGTVEVKAVGDTLGNAPNGPKVDSISSKEIVLCFQGEKITMALEEEKRR